MHITFLFILRCSVGHYCPEGVDAEIRCASGHYQDLETQSDCMVCPAGYFCDNTMGIVVLDNSTTVCPMGSYCPSGTQYANEFLCPIGTFSNITGEILLICGNCYSVWWCVPWVDTAPRARSILMSSSAILGPSVTSQVRFCLFCGGFESVWFQKSRNAMVVACGVRHACQTH